MNTEPTSPPRIPLVSSIDARLETPSDGRIVNGYTEKTVDGEVVIKRPAFTLFRPFGGFVAGGCFAWIGNVYAVSNWGFFANGSLVGLVDSSGGYYSFSPCFLNDGTRGLVLHNQANIYVFDSVSLTHVPFSGTFCPGASFLDGTLYLLSKFDAAVVGSALNNPNTWNPLNKINARKEPDIGVAILKHLQYVLVMKQWSMEAFWDAGNPVGSPLQPAPGTLIPFGCRDAASVQQFEDLILWASATKSGNTGVMMMENLQPQTVSTPAVERLLQDANWTSVYSWSGRISGHRFYCLTLPASNLSLVYDITTQRWFQWTHDGGYVPFRFCTQTEDDKRVILQHENGDLYTLSQTDFLDDGQDIMVDIYTPNWDGGTRRRKYLQRLEVIADQTGSHSVQLRWSDDDYQTWSNFRTINLGKNRPFTEDLGTFYRRAFHLRYNAPTAFRAKALECINILLGSE